jgi:hypothetical protein
VEPGVRRGDELLFALRNAAGPGHTVRVTATAAEPGARAEQEARFAAFLTAQLGR